LAASRVVETWKLAVSPTLSVPGEVCSTLMKEPLGE
jgi:hypothetical protein